MDFTRIYDKQIGWLIAFIVLLGGLSFWAGSCTGTRTASQTISDLEQQLETCEEGQQAAIREGQDAAGWVALADLQIGQLKAEKEQLEKNYADSLRTIRTMLPADAERALADHYRRRYGNDGSGSGGAIQPGARQPGSR